MENKIEGVDGENVPVDIKVRQASAWDVLDRAGLSKKQVHEVSATQINVVSTESVEHLKGVLAEMNEDG